MLLPAAREEKLPSPRTWQAAGRRYRLAARNQSEFASERTKMSADEEQFALRAVCAVLARYGEGVAGGAGAESVAYEWLAAGFADAEEVEDWLRARCFRAQHAQALERAGFTPEQAALRTTAGRGAY